MLVQCKHSTLLVILGASLSVLDDDVVDGQSPSRLQDCRTPTPVRRSLSASRSRLSSVPLQRSSLLFLTEESLPSRPRPDVVPRSVCATAKRRLRSFSSSTALCPYTLYSQPFHKLRFLIPHVSCPFFGLSIAFFIVFSFILVSVFALSPPPAPPPPPTPPPPPPVARFSSR